MPVEDRVTLLRSLRFVDEVWVCQSHDGSDAIRLFCPSYFVKGKDYDYPGGLSIGEVSACRMVGALIAFTQTEKKSSTEIIERISKWKEQNEARSGTIN